MSDHKHVATRGKQACEADKLHRVHLLQSSPLQAKLTWDWLEGGWIEVSGNAKRLQGLSSHSLRAMGRRQVGGAGLGKHEAGASQIPLSLTPSQTLLGVRSYASRLTDFGPNSQVVCLKLHVSCTAQAHFREQCLWCGSDCQLTQTAPQAKYGMLPGQSFPKLISTNITSGKCSVEGSWHLCSAMLSLRQGCQCDGNFSQGSVVVSHPSRLLPASVAKP